MREIPLDSPEFDEVVGEYQKSQLLDEIELLDGASAEFDQELVSKGELSPVFFGSALTNFGVEIFLKHFLQMTTSPLARKADCGIVDPMKEEFSAFVFKIQANMNKAHQRPASPLCGSAPENSMPAWKCTMYRETRKCVFPSLSR